MNFRIGIYGFDSLERETIRMRIEERSIEVNCENNLIIYSVPLERNQLRAFTFGDLNNANMIILCHYNEGRVLLTDKDGLYNDFLQEAIKMTSGNVFLALSGVHTDGLANLETVNALTNSGEQQSIHEIYDCGRFLTWYEEPTAQHVSQILLAIKGEVPLISIPAGILSNSVCPHTVDDSEDALSAGASIILSLIFSIVRVGA